MTASSPRTFESRASFVLGVASQGAEVLAILDAWGARLLAGDDVMGFCRSSIASPTALLFLLLRILALLGTVAMPLVLVVELARGGPRKSLLPGLSLALLLLLYFACQFAGALPHPPRHPCLH